MTRRVNASDALPANAIRRGRGRLHLTQDQLARRIGVGVRSLQDWEAGKSLPRSRHLHALADAFGIEVGDLFGTEPRDEALATLVGRLERRVERQARALFGIGVVTVSVATAHLVSRRGLR